MSGGENWWEMAWKRSHKYKSWNYTNERLTVFLNWKHTFLEMFFNMANDFFLINTGDGGVNWVRYIHIWAQLYSIKN